MDNEKRTRVVSAEYQDWIDHQYLPGYWTGGRMVPHLRLRAGRNWFGLPLVLIGIALLGLALLHGLTLDGVMSALFSILLLASGARLLRGRRQRR